MENEVIGKLWRAFEGAEWVKTQTWEQIIYTKVKNFDLHETWGIKHVLPKSYAVFLPFDNLFSSAFDLNCILLLNLLVFNQSMAFLVNLQKAKGQHILHKALSIVQSSGNSLNTGVKLRTQVLLSSCLCFNWFAPFPKAPCMLHLILTLWSQEEPVASSYKIERKRERERRRRRRSREGQPVASIKNLKTNSLWRNVRLDSSEAGSASCGCN